MALEKIRPRVVDETGNYTFNNVTATGSLISANANLGNIATANYVRTDHLQYANGAAWSIGTGSVVGSNTQVQFNDGGTDFGASSNFTFNKATNVLTVTNITANGAGLTSLTGANVTGTVANATYATSAGTATTATNAGTVTTNAQPNITSVGSLSTLTVTGNLVSGNAELGNSTTSNYYLGNGYFLSSVSGGNVLGQVAYAGTANSVAGSNVVGAVTYASTANAVAGGNVMGQVGNALIAGTVYTNAQPNITSVGTLTSLDVTGNVSANYFIGNGSQLTGITFAGDYSNTNTAAYLIANPPTGTYSNVNVAAYLPTYTGNVSANYFIGNGSTLTNITGANITGNAPFAGTANYANTANAITGANVSGNVASAVQSHYANIANSVAGANVSGQVGNSLIAGTVYTNTQPNITSVGTLTSLIVSGNITSGNANLGNNVSANFFTGNGYYLTGIQASGITGSYSNTNVASYLPTYGGNVTANYYSGTDLTINRLPITYSINFSGSNYANVTSGSGLLGSGDYTIEFWIKTTDGENGIMVSTPAGISGHPAIFVSGNSLVFQRRYAVASTISEDITSYLNDAWHHIAFVRGSGTISLYIDGTRITTASNSDDYSAVTAGLAFGWSPQTFNYLNGYLSNFRIVSGTALYSGATLTVPTSPLTAVSGTTLLLFQSSTLVDNSSYARALTSSGSPTISSSVTPFAGYLGTGNITSGNASLGNLTTSNYFSGNGSLLTSLTGANITGNAPFAGTANYANTANSITGSNVSGNVSWAITSNYANTANAIAGANVTGQVGNALLAGTVYTNAQPNITSVGTLTSLNVSGNAIVGNLTVTGTTTTVNSTTTQVVDPIFELGGGANGAALSTDDNKDRGILLHYYSGSSTVDAFMGWDDSNGEFGFGSNVSVSSEVVTWNSYANVRGNYFIGNGYYLSGVDQLAAGSADVANSIANGTSNINTPYLDGPITVGIGGAANAVVFTSTGINVAGYSNIGGTVTAGTGTGGSITGANAITSNYFIGDGSYLTSITGANVTGYVPTSSLANTVTTNAQPNITSVGTLTSLSVTGNVSANYFIGNGSQLTGITGTYSNTNVASYLTANPPTGTYSNTNVAAYLPTYTGNFTAGNINLSYTTTSTANLGNSVRANYFVGNGAYLTGVDLLTVGNADIANSIANGTSNINTTVANGNITVNIGGTANTVVFANTGNYITTTGNVSASYLFGNGSQLTGVAATSVTGGNVSGNVSTANIAYYVNVTSNSTNTSSFFIPFVSSTGNSAVYIDTTANDLSYQPSSGNLTAAYHVGNGYYLTGITATASLPITSGTSNININSGGNATVSIGGTANILVVSTSGLTVTNNVDVGLNYFKGNGFYLTGVDTAGKVANGSSNLSINTNSGNITMGVGGFSNVVVVAGTGINVAGYANITGIISTNSNVAIGSAGYFVGNGYYLTGIGGAGYIFNGTSNANIGTANGNFTIGINGTANVVVVSNTGINLQYTTSAVANLGNLVTSNYFVGNGNLLTSLTGANVTGQVGNALLAGTVYTNAQPNITSVGNLTSLVVTGTTNLGTVGNITIGGGAANYYLKTDGAGNLTWSAVSGGGGGTSLTYTTDTHPPATGNLLGDQWFNTTTSVLYEYISDGTASYWVDISSPSITTTPGTGSSGTTRAQAMTMGIIFGG